MGTVRANSGTPQGANGFWECLTAATIRGALSSKLGSILAVGSPCALAVDGRCGMGGMQFSSSPQWC